MGCVLNTYDTNSRLLCCASGRLLSSGFGKPWLFQRWRQTEGVSYISVLIQKLSGPIRPSASRSNVPGATCCAAGLPSAFGNSFGARTGLVATMAWGFRGLSPKCTCEVIPASHVSSETLGSEVVFRKGFIDVSPRPQSKWTPIWSRGFSTVYLHPGGNNEDLWSAAFSFELSHATGMFVPSGRIL